MCEFQVAPLTDFKCVYLFMSPHDRLPTGPRNTAKSPVKLRERVSINIVLYIYAVKLKFQLPF